MTIEFFLFSLIQSQCWKTMGVVLKVGMAGAIHFSVGHHILHDIIFFPLGYKIEKLFLQLAHFYSMKFRCNRCVYNTVILFTTDDIPLEI